MKVAFALLPGLALQNDVRRLGWEIHERWSTGTRPRALPPHVSLKQPFDVDGDFPAVERYFATLAASVAPVDLQLGKLLLWETVLSIDVASSPSLLALHARLNVELRGVVRDPAAPFDGERYHFHLTIATGGASADTYREIHATYAEAMAARVARATELAMFVYDTRRPDAWQYMTHTVLPLGGPR